MTFLVKAERERGRSNETVFAYRWNFVFAGGGVCGILLLGDGIDCRQSAGNTGYGQSAGEKVLGAKRMTGSRFGGYGFIDKKNGQPAEKSNLFDSAGIYCLQHRCDGGNFPVLCTEWRNVRRIERWTAANAAGLAEDKQFGRTGRIISPAAEKACPLFHLCHARHWSDGNRADLSGQRMEKVLVGVTDLCRVCSN